VRNGPSILADAQDSLESPPDDPPPRRRTALGLVRTAETLFVLLLATGLTVFMHVRQFRGLRDSVPGDTGDPVLIGWQLGWAGHVLRTLPADPWTTPAFLGAADNFAFTDATWGYAPLTWLAGDGMTGSLTMLNLAGLIAGGLAFAGAYLLARVLGSGLPGALVAGAGFAYAPWRLSQITHLNVYSTGGIALALALLVLGHGWSLRSGYSRRPRAGWLALGWAVACWQLTMGFATGIVFGYVLGAVAGLLVLGLLVHGRRLPPARVLVTDLLGGLAFAAVAWWMSRPFWRVVHAHPEGRRDENWIRSLSPPWRGLLTAPDRDLLWAPRQASWRELVGWTAETAILPGAVLIALAALGLLVSAWPWRRRLALAAVTAAIAVLALGTEGPDDGRWSFLPLYHHLPGWDTMRTPGRLILWVTLGLGLLAAGLITTLSDVLARPRAPRHERTRERELGEDVFDPGSIPTRPLPARHGPVWWLLAAPFALLLCLPAAAVVYEGHGEVPQWPVARPPVALASLPQPVLVLPSVPVFGDYKVMLWGADGWVSLANGSSGFEPAFQEQFRAEVGGFPDTISVAALRRRGIRTVLLLPSDLGGTKWENALLQPAEGLGISWRSLPDGSWLYDIPAAG
jgi:hypothetical protein